MKIKTRDHGEVEVDPTWIKEWTEIYLNVPEKLIQLQGYCRDDGKKTPTKRGLRRFLGSIIRKDCPMREPVRKAALIAEERPEVTLNVRQDFLRQMKSKLRRKDETTI